MDINAEAAYIRQQLESRNIPTKEARKMLDDLDNMAVYGGLVAYFAAATALILTLVIPGRRGLITAMRFSTVRLFLGAGFFVFLAQMFRFAALSIAPVAVVSPLQRSGASFTLGLSWAVDLAAHYRNFDFFIAFLEHRVNVIGQLYDIDIGPPATGTGHQNGAFMP